MARHIMAVCVVCLLCADRLPCEQHYDDDGGVVLNTKIHKNRNANLELNNKNLNAKVFQRFDAATHRNYVDNDDDDDDVKRKSIKNNYNSHTNKQATNQAAKLQFYSTEYINDNLLAQHLMVENDSSSSRSDSSSRSSSSTTKNQAQQHRRSKRHTHGHGHSHDDGDGHDGDAMRPAITDDFLQRIFNEYGHGDGSLSINEFRLMLKQLGLHKLLENKLEQQHPQSQQQNTTSCIADTSLIQHLQNQISNEEEHHHHHRHHHTDDESNHQHDNKAHSNDASATANCALNATNGIAKNGTAAGCVYGLDSSTQNSYLNNYTIKDVDLLNLCPVLLYQLASTTESKRAGCIDEAILIEIDERTRKNSQNGKEDVMYVWIYAFISVFACGILGLVGVAIIPFMDSRYYKHIIQYLVSLAVGTMTGDALLHLLPHSLANHDENGMILKGLTCMGGIIFFYITEHGLTMISEWRKRKAKKETKQSRAKVMRDPDSSITNSGAGDKLCKSKYSSYPYCYDEIAMDTKNDVWMHLPNQTIGGGTGGTSTASANPTDKLTISSNVSVGSTAAERKRNGRAEANTNENAMAAQSLLSTSHNNYAQTANHHQHHDDHHQQTNHIELEQSEFGTGNGAASAADGKAIDDGNKAIDTVTVILREHESSHHGHSHKHGHVHSPPESLSAVAWMIIMGDGLHNFTDGMAIGAAFADNIAGGFSTSLAVFCHELPHELGDFAILMKAGMSVKSAVYYNLLTGVLSFIGMIVGIVFGQSQDAAQWMFAAAAGLFIYIALVDMMPELSAAHKSIEQLALQIFGMSTGVLLMLLIAIYEGELMNAFSSSSSSSSNGPASGH